MCVRRGCPSRASCPASQSPLVLQSSCPEAASMALKYRLPPSGVNLPGTDPRGPSQDTPNQASAGLAFTFQDQSPRREAR